MTLVDATKNTDAPAQGAFRELRDAVKLNGTHYSKNGEAI